MLSELISELVPKYCPKKTLKFKSISKRLKAKRQAWLKWHSNSTKAAITIVNDQLDSDVLRSSETLSYKNHIDALYRKVNPWRA